MKILYIGPEGSHSHSSALFMFRSDATEIRTADEFIPVNSNEEIFKILENDSSFHGIIPIENIEGDITENFNKLFNGKLKIFREMFMKTSNNLLLNQNTKIEDVKTFYGTVRTVKECKKFIGDNSHLTVQLVSSTSEAARLVSVSTSNDCATIASLTAAEKYGLKVENEGLCDDENVNNFTRFIALTRSLEDFPPNNANKATMVFNLENKPGTLLGALQALLDKNYSLVKIQSRPVANSENELTFLIDVIFEDLIDITEFQQKVNNLEIIGIYREGVKVRER